MFDLYQIIEVMTPWEVIEQALARRRPPRSQEWLAAELSSVTGQSITAQAITNWKVRGVPRGRYTDLADVLGLTTDQVAGRAPLPWERHDSWPFPGIDPARFDRLTELQRGEIQGKVREMIERFEVETSQSGKSSGSGGRSVKSAHA